MGEIRRRSFLKASLGAAAAVSVSRSTRGVAPSDRVVLGIMGCGGRGTLLARWFAALPGVEVAYLCDVNERRFEWAVENVEQAQERSPKLVGDFRRILDDPEVDALVNATPDHWHAPATILACQAGKDVYVEKPLSHNIWEGVQMIAAARKYERVVQVGAQTRSSEYVQRGIQYIREGRLGAVHMVRVNNQTYYQAEQTVSEQPVPRGLDWDMWCGPAPLVPYRPGTWFYNLWDFGCGTIAGEAVHQLDLTRMLLGLDYPLSAVHAGGVFRYQDGRETPDTQVVTFEFPSLTLVLEGALWAPYMKKIPNSIRDSDEFPNWPFTSTKVEIFGSEGFMNFGRQGGGWQAYGADGEVVASQSGRQGDQLHLQDFISCIRTRRQPVGDVEEGHKSAMFGHLANISFRLGNRKIRFDPQSQTIPGDDEANRLLRREYREPWSVPEEV
jgi:predicted dehydrogenase